MSYCRLDGYSDVYVYGNKAGYAIILKMPLYNKQFFEFKTLLETYIYLKGLKTIGYKVPDRVFIRMKKELE